MAAGLAPQRLTLDFDASLVNVHTDKERAAPTYKRGFGFHPLMVCLDQTGEALAAKLRPGSAGANITEAVRLAVSEIREDAWQTPMTRPRRPRRRRRGRDHRREEPHVGAQFNLFDPAGWRHQVFITNFTDIDIVYLEARHRGHARVVDHIKAAKDLGLLRFPGHDFAANAVWLLIIGIAQDLTAWTQHLAFTGELAHCESKRLRYCVWHTAGRLVHSGRRRILRLDAAWPWAK